MNILMIKGLIFDIGDIIYDIPFNYKIFSPLLMLFRIENLILWTASVMIRRGFYKRKYTQKDMDKLKKSIQPREGVVETLRKLKNKKIKITFLTDTIVSPLRIDKRLEALGVRQYVDNIVCSSRIGVHKPSKKAYDIAVNETGIRHSEILFVGHAKDEIEGAKKAGLKTIGYNLDPGTKPDYHAKEFSDILKIIGEVNAKRRNNRP